MESSQMAVVIHDASRDLNTSGVRWALGGLSMNPGDKLTLLGVLHQVDTPMGYKSKVGSGSMFGASRKVVKEAVDIKVQEYQSNADIMEIGELCESREIDFKIEVAAGPSRKEMALEVASNLKATWVILDRHMKKDKTYFLQKLSCGISQMDGNVVKHVRGPKLSRTQTRPVPPVPIQNNNVNEVVQEQVQPQPADREPSPAGPELFSIEINSRAGGDELSRKDPEVTEGPAERDLLSQKDPNVNAGPEEGDELSKTLPSITEVLVEGDELSKTLPSITEVLVEGDELSEKDPDVTESAIDEAVKTWQVDVGLGDSGCCENKRLDHGYTRQFTYKELHNSTGGFSPGNSLSTEEFGSAFRGKLKDGTRIFIKKNKDAYLEKDEFESKVDVLSRVSHKNVIMLLGSCGEGNNRILVYEYACKGSLDQHISEYSSTPLTWTQRINIALGASRGLLHLHENRIIHRDIRSNNILLTHDFEPLIGELGITGMKHDNDKFSEDRIRCCDYQAPEYTENGILSSKTDVYSFGVVLLELITGRVATEITEKKISLLDWTRPLLSQRKYLELVDPRLDKSYDVHQLVWLVQVTQKCLLKNPKRRLTMDRVVSALEFLSERGIAITEATGAQSDEQAPEGLS